MQLSRWRFISKSLSGPNLTNKWNKQYVESQLEKVNRALSGHGQIMHWYCSLWGAYTVVGQNVSQTMTWSCIYAKLPNRATTPDTGLERSDQRARSSNPVPDSYTLRPGLAFSIPAPQNYSLTPGPSTPGLVLPIPDNPSFCPVSNKSGSGGISQAPLLQFSTSICFTQCTDVTSSTWMWKYFHATSSCWTRMCCALHCDQSRTEYTCNSWKIICICCWTTTFN